MCTAKNTVIFPSSVQKMLRFYVRVKFLALNSTCLILGIENLLNAPLHASQQRNVVSYNQFAVVTATRLEN